ncbi:hypothetical protein AAE269_003620 [Escherichia coli]|uniref:Phage protein n=6 Tax=Enterobacteriaceae TaxID=543 RepID=A0A0F3VKY1_ECOLX|nr:hypothetical protein [Escherichia coli]EFA8161320.1 hypothetical protein [Escherichia coli O103]EFT1062805.1 hypothetical protein [Shigella sonnei]EFW3286531.1 hypothetical protein [Shigella flexneri]EHW23971.1 hypothetical protein ECDEC8C_1017 [Escherichia coli DEC8C]EHW67819.1 hypothetical protein ECDEC10A_0963 [Escherichia coli DEC10A]EHW76980.1 hypothetical protein ECDEC10B_1089 [Escherichia coli DEC10B]EHW82655.1 hypothetical protein ECDEC10D_0939 [Escherichia coli DEC10D]EIG5925062
MKQMTLIEMDGFLKGKCIPSDLKVDETNDEYLVRKFGELESKLETALRECRSAGITIDNLEAKCAKMAAENSSLKQSEKEFNDFCREEFSEWEDDITETPATDAFLAEVKTEARKEGAYFVANRMLAAWEAGFIDDTAKNAADIARMILTSTEFMANAPEGDFDRSFSDGVLEDIAEQLRKGVIQ